MRDRDWERDWEKERESKRWVGGGGRGGPGVARDVALKVGGPARHADVFHASRDLLPAFSVRQKTPPPSLVPRRCVEFFPGWRPYM